MDVKIGARSSPPKGGEFDSDEALYRFLVDSLTEYAVFAVSLDGFIVSWNTGAQQTFGYTRDEVIGQPFGMLFTAEDARAGAPQNELDTGLSGEQTDHDRWHVRKNGTLFWGTNTVQPFYNTVGALMGFTKLVRDGTASHAALEQLSDSEQRLRLLVESVHDYAIFSLALDGTITSWNTGAQSTFGYVQQDVIGAPYAMLFSTDDVTAGVPAAELREATERDFCNNERWLLRKDGTRFLSNGKLRLLKRDAAGELRGFVIVVHDITEHELAAQDLRRRAQFDQLTELANRHTFFEHVHRAIATMKRRPANLFAVLFIDLDHFKSVNDEFGHFVADQLLAVTARRLERCVRSDDIVARIGGDEFAILLNGINGVADANDAAERIGTEMRRPVEIDECNVRATASVGIALGNVEYNSPEDILRDADAAMYAAKSDGRARAALYNAGMASGNHLRSDLAADLRHAVERDELRIAYQPVIRMRDKVIDGFEALVRWQHPRRGLLQPLDFISKAEESDLIVSIDRWMLGEASAQLARWQAQNVVGANVKMSVNVSSKQFARKEFVDDLRRILETSGLPAGSLRLEITESALMERSERTYGQLAAIRTLGIQLHLDDFGTGYASLGVLQRVTVDALKIDFSFVAALDSRIGTELVRTVITLAHNLGIVAIAEGIETPWQLRRLDALGCDFCQGFFLAKPLDAAGAARFLTDAEYAMS